MARLSLRSHLPYLYAVLPLLALGLSTIPIYDTFRHQVFVAVAGLALLVAMRVQRTKERYPVLNQLLLGVIIFAMLLLVVNTGWFFSPFLFTIYLVVVAISLLYSPYPAIVFLIVLAALFIPSIQPVGPWYDVVRIVSLFTALPLSVFFSSEFLALRESQKKILILEDQRDTYKSELERLQKNKLIWNNVMLRQSLSTARNYALYWSTHKKHDVPDKLRRDLSRTAEKLELALTDIKKFEQQHVDDSFL